MTSLSWINDIESLMTKNGDFAIVFLGKLNVSFKMNENNYNQIDSGIIWSSMLQLMSEFNRFHSSLMLVFRGLN